jgi:hypothetical protein
MSLDRQNTDYSSTATHQRNVGNDEIMRSRATDRNCRRFGKSKLAFHGVALQISSNAQAAVEAAVPSSDTGRRFPGESRKENRFRNMLAIRVMPSPACVEDCDTAHRARTWRHPGPENTSLQG